MKKTRIFSFLLTTICIASQAQAPLAEGFDHPQDTARTKVLWFFGETETTREGITADLEAFKEAGVGGVVYPDEMRLRYLQNTKIMLTFAYYETE